ncbi:MAG: PQQ-binding-like beta-propeller repeat protein [Verrucomicrobiaceae bacterium]|nr:PQQ-binding-like beta-propeller repeat protein [Verrucomicrobiaceae bacterium]
MRLRQLIFMVIACPAFHLGSVKAGDWPQWRGMRHDGIADAARMPPLKFSATENVRWEVPVPGRGHGSPIIHGKNIFLATADERSKTQSLICLDRDTGKITWSREVHRGGFPKKSNKKASHASSTPACDGKSVFISFLNAGAVYTTAFDLKGEQLWQTKITDYILHQGFATSPAIYKSLLIVSADNKGGGAVCGLRREDGSVAWRIDRPKYPNYASPVIYRINGSDQLIFQGCNLVSSYDPANGKKRWQVKGATTECVSSIVTDGVHVFTSGGYPRNHVSAMKADGSGEAVWENISRVYVPSMLVKDGYLFAVMDNGNAMCWKCDTGEQMWRERLNRTTSASPVLVGDHIYAVDEQGNFSVFRANPKSFKVLAKNKLGDQVFATPVICDGRIYARVVESTGEVRQEKLYCIGEK